MTKRETKMNTGLGFRVHFQIRVKIIIHLLKLNRLYGQRTFLEII